MTKLTKILANKGTQNACFCGIFVILATLFIGNAECASSRGTVARRTQTVARTQPVKKQNDIKTTETLRSDTLLDEDQQEEDDSDNTTKKQPIAVKKPKADTVPEPELVIEEQEIIVEDKTSLFDDVLGDALGVSVAVDSAVGLVLLVHGLHPRDCTGCGRCRRHGQYECPICIGDWEKHM